MKIRQKILIGYFIVLVAFVATGFIGISNMQKMQRSYADLINQRVSLVSETKDFLTNFEYEALMMRTYFLTGKEEWAEEYRDHAQMDKAILDNIRSKLTSEEEIASFEKLAGTVNTYNEHYARPMMEVRGRDDLTEQQKLAEITRMTLEQKGTVRGVIRLGEEIVAYQEKLLAEAVRNNAQLAAKVTGTTTVMAVVALALALAAAMFISRVITDPVKELEAEAKRIAEGDLTPRELPPMGGDEVGNLVRSFGAMTEKLRNLAERMHHSANLITTYTHELQASTRNAAAAANATSDKMSQLSGVMTNMVEGSRSLAEVSDRTAANLSGVEQTAEKFLYKMENSAAITIRASNDVKDLEERLQNVGEVIQFITNIADQASLLAQKAVTEVAYVSDEGNTFISLADEIQKRARDASGAAKSIAGLIENVQRHARLAADSLEEDHKIILDGHKAAKEASVSIKTALKEMQALAVQVNEVAAVTEQVARSINNVTRASEEQAALAEGFAKATGTLSHVANEMKSTVATLKLQ